MKKFGIILLVFACLVLSMGAAPGIPDRVKEKHTLITTDIPAPAMPGKARRKAADAYNVPIVMYHSIAKHGSGKYCITPATLEKDLLYLKENGFTAIVFSDLIAYQKKGAPLPEKPVMLTFDDGYANNYRNAFPLLKKHGMKGVIAVVGRWADDNIEGGRGKGAHLTYEQIKEMHGSGVVEIQSHTYDMHKTGRGGRYGMKKTRAESTQQYKEVLKTDLLTNHNKILKHTGITMTALAFPFGAYSKECFEVLKEIGYKASLTCTEGVNTITRSSDLYRLKRYNRPSGRSSAEFFAKITARFSAFYAKISV